MEMFAFASAVRGYHVYHHVVKPPIGENHILCETSNGSLKRTSLTRISSHNNEMGCKKVFQSILNFAFLRSKLEGRREGRVGIVGSNRGTGYDRKTKHQGFDLFL